MRIAAIAGHYSTGLHGKIDAERLFESRALTGSESSFFNVVRGLAESELQHEVTVFCDVEKPLDRCEKLAGARVRHIDENIGDDFDGYISLNEPDQFRRLVKPKGPRIVQMQLNDFPYCQKGYEKFVDYFMFLSPVHREHLLKVTPEIASGNAFWIPNSINLELTAPHLGLPKIPHSMAWCSSPDRGLHRILEIFPDIRKRVPDATLKIYYRFEPWYEEFKNHNSKTGARARYIGEALRILGKNGENGVTLVGPVPNTEIAKVLCQTDVLPYTCDCITFTEGFSVAIMDACAAGAIPIISDADAIGDIYQSVAKAIPGKVGDNRQLWIDTIVSTLTQSEESKKYLRERMSSFAAKFRRQIVAKLWEKLLIEGSNSLPKTISEYIDSRDVSSPEAYTSYRLKTENVKTQNDVEMKVREVEENSIKRTTWEHKGKTLFYYRDKRNDETDLARNEPEVKERWWHISKGDVVLDIGGAYGAYTLSALAQGAKLVLTWSPEHYAPFLKQNIDLNGFSDRTIVIETGLWSERGYLTSNYPRMPSFSNSKVSELHFPVETLDGSVVMEILRREGCNWLKIDAEGAELEILKGAEQVLAIHRPRILVENHTFKRAAIADEVADFLKKMGYKEIGRVPYTTEFSHSYYEHQNPYVVESDEQKSPHKNWMMVGDPHPDGGQGPTCPDCGLSTWVELGGASAPHAYHPNIDIRAMEGVDIVHDLRKMPLPIHDGHADRVKSIHSINHLPHVDAIAMLKDSLRILKPGGHLYIMVTDVEFAMKRALIDGFHEDWMGCIYGTKGDTYPEDFHYWGYSPDSLKKILEDIGYERVKFLGHMNGWEFKMEAYKPGGTSPVEPRKAEKAEKAPAFLKGIPEVSVLTSTFRPGGLDLTFAGMRDQTHRDFELIVVDKRYQKRKNRVLELKKQYGDFPMLYVPEHRSNGKWVTFCSAWNTSIALARGKYVIFMQDYAYCPPGWIESHIATLEKNPLRFTLAPYDYYDYPELKTNIPYDFSNQRALGDRCTEVDPTLTGAVFDEIQVFKKGFFEPSWIPELTIGDHQWRECRSQMAGEGLAVSDTWVHIKNESAHRDLIWKINGLDERLERGKGPMDIDVGLRIVNAGGELYWHGECPHQVSINPRFFCRNHPWGAMHEQLEGRWSFDNGMEYNQLQRDRKAFFAQNLYRIEDLAKELAPWREPNANPQSRDISDLAYWRKEIWPDTPPFWKEG